MCPAQVLILPFKMYLKFRSKPPDSVVMLAVLTVCSLVLPARTDTVFTEQRVNTKRILTLADSPYYIENDVLVEPEGELFIQPGVTLKFAAGVGITVRGVLTAEGLPDNKIVFTSAGETFRQENRTIRLIDGPTVQQGIIQVRGADQSGVLISSKSLGTELKISPL